MIKKIITLGLYFSYLLFSLPVLANSEPKHLYPANPFERRTRKEEFSKYRGYNNRDYLITALGYYMSILDSKTPKGYSYCACNPEFGVRFHPAYKRNGYPADGIGFQ